MTIQNSDDIINEIRRYRETHAKALDYDPRRIARELQRQENESDAPVLSRPARVPKALSKGPSPST